MPRFRRLTGLVLALCLVLTGCSQQAAQETTRSLAVLQPVSSESAPVVNPQKEQFKAFLSGQSEAYLEEENPGFSLPEIIEPEPEASSQSSASQPEPPEETLTIQDVNASSGEAPESTPISTVSSPDELRGIWISYLDFNTLLKGKSASAFQSSIGDAFDNIAALGLNTVFVQVRPYGDALYPSAVFPWSHTVTGTEGVDPGYDPLAIMVEAAHSRGLRLEAWINPYRIRNSNTKAALSDDNPAASLLSQGSDAVIQYGTLISYNPASQTARELIVKGVEEIVRNYDVDGIHFDDYFYPTTDAAFDRDSYAAYQNSGGSLELAQWRRENVNKLVSSCYQAVKAIDSSVSFGVSPQGNNDNNLNNQYVDVSKWLTSSGYVDYICPQIYFGFRNSTAPYAEMVEEWNHRITSSSVKLYIGLAAYKLGSEDTWAGDGKREWIDTTDILSRMVAAGREASGYGGFVLFRYDFVFPASGAGDQLLAERENLSRLLD